MKSISTTDSTRTTVRVRLVYLLLAALIITFDSTGSVLAQSPTDTHTGPKMRVAVASLVGSALTTQTTYQASSTNSITPIPPPSDFALGLTEMLTTSLVQTGRFVVLERAAIDKVTGEQDFGASGRVNPETAPVKRKIIGAQVLINGDITEFTYQQSSYGGKAALLQQLEAKVEKVTAMVALDIRLIDATTGEVVFSKRAKGKASMTGVAADFKIGNQGFAASASANTPLGKASREAIEGAVAAIVAGLKPVSWSGRIIDVREGQIYINSGADAGTKPGMQFDVYEQQESLVDPDTGKALGTPDRRIGSVTVDMVEDKYSIARVTDGNNFKRNHVVRFKGQPQKP